MLEGYITPSKDTPSRSGLYANGLPGVTLQLLDDLTKEDEEDFMEFWEDVYQRAIVNFVSNIQAKLADKFHVDLKLASRETSKFEDDTNVSGLISGLSINYRLPRYGKTQIISVEVDSIIDQEFEFYIYDKDEFGKILKTVTATLTAGLNTINIDTYFSSDKIFIGYDTTMYQLAQTTNKHFDNDEYGIWDTLSCSFPCYFGTASVDQINGGGFNVIWNATCSIEKVIEQNINIFRDSFWYFIGQELMFERVHSDKFNRWTTLTRERASDLLQDYDFWVEQKTSNAVKSLRMREDPICFSCKAIVSKSYQLP